MAAHGDHLYTNHHNNNNGRPFVFRKIRQYPNSSSDNKSDKSSNGDFNRSRNCHIHFPPISELKRNHERSLSQRHNSNIKRDYRGNDGIARYSYRNQQTAMMIRGGNSDNFFFVNERRLSASQQNILYETVAVVWQVISTTGRVVLPPLVASVRATVGFYRALPMDVIVAQIGLVYAFAGGYYPTLFAAIQAAQHCGYPAMIQAIQVLTNEAVVAMRACDVASRPSSSSFQQRTATTKRDVVMEQARIVLATIDPVRINDAAVALYTAWMSISVVLEREFARTIALSVTLSESIRPVVSFVLNKPLQLCVPVEYNKWIPILIGWSCKAIAMSMAWRIQRVLTAYTSAIAGGMMCSRAVFRMIHQHGFRRWRPRRPHDLDTTTTTTMANNTSNFYYLDDLLGCMIASMGLYSQIGRGFRCVEVPFPLNWITWPLDVIERWIQWQITKEAASKPPS
jgi:hypothetical protein